MKFWLLYIKNPWKFSIPLWEYMDIRPILHFTTLSLYIDKVTPILYLTKVYNITHVYGLSFRYVSIDKILSIWSICTILPY